jgi:hypothetical protein
MEKAVKRETVTLQRSMSSTSVDGWDSRGLPIIHCSRVEAAIKAGAAFVRTPGKPPERRVFRVMPDGGLREIQPHWVFDLNGSRKR